jgi:hypothetical protein
MALLHTFTAAVFALGQAVSKITQSDRAAMQFLHNCANP